MDEFEAECLCEKQVQVLPARGSGSGDEFVYTTHTKPDGFTCMYVNARVPRTRTVHRKTTIRTVVRPGKWSS